jgi:hypothetical protein
VSKLEEALRVNPKELHALLLLGLAHTSQASLILMRTFSFQINRLTDESTIRMVSLSDCTLYVRILRSFPNYVGGVNNCQTVHCMYAYYALFQILWEGSTTVRLSDCRSHCHLVKFRGLMYGGRYSAVIGWNNSFLYAPIRILGYGFLSDKSQRRPRRILFSSDDDFVRFSNSKMLV